jgi:signal transduction histidine kinase
MWIATASTPSPTAAGDAAARPRQRHRRPEFRGCARPCGRASAPDARPRAQGEASVLEFTEPASGRRIRTAFTPDQIDPGQPINGVYLLSTDVTEEAQARAALAQTHKRELAAQLTSGLAHDFANLLTIILGLQGGWRRCPCPKAPRS